MRIAGWLGGCNRWDSTCCSQPVSQRSSSSAILIASDPHPHPQRSSSSAIVIAGSRYAMRPSHACTQILIHTRAMCGDRAHGPASGGAPRGSVWPLPCGGCAPTLPGVMPSLRMPAEYQQNHFCKKALCAIECTTEFCSCWQIIHLRR